MNTRIVGIGSLTFAGLLACSSPSSVERHGTVEQPVEYGLLPPPPPPNGGDPAALAADAGACAHDVCATGEALRASCDPCATNLCDKDPYCCQSTWDATCVSEVESICGKSCTAPAPAPVDPDASTCLHPICAVGAALIAGCDPCATQLCASDPYCCTSIWDATCVGEVGSICGKTCN